MLYFDFMAIINLRIHMRWDREMVQGVTLHPQSLFTVKFLMIFQICHPRRIKRTVNSKRTVDSTVPNFRFSAFMQLLSY